MNCFDCKHRQTAFSDLSNVQGMEHIKDKWYGRCAAGFTETMVRFHQENGSKRREEVTESVPCFEATKISKTLDAAIDLTNQLLAKIKRENGL